MNESFERPFETIRRVFSCTVPDVPVGQFLGSLEPGDTVLGVASERAQFFFNQSRHLMASSTGKPSGFQSPQSWTPGNSQQVRFWNMMPPQRQKDMLVTTLTELFWEHVFSELPEVQNVVDCLVLRQGYKIVVEGPAVPTPIVPEICPRNDQLYRFMPRLEDIFLGKCSFEGTPDYVSPPGSVCVGRLENELVKQIVILEVKLRRRMDSLFPGFNHQDAHLKFAAEPHMHYIRYDRLHHRMMAQVVLLGTLAGIGIMDQMLDIELPGNMEETGEYQCVLHVDKNWDITMLTHKS